MTEYRIKNIKDHILIDSAGELLLIDTGSPVSFNENGRMTLCGETLTVPTSIMGTDMQYVSERLGVHVNGLIGMDFIGAHPMSIDISAGVIVFDCDLDGYSCTAGRTVPGAATCTMEIDGTRASVIIDTGAPVSYISRRYTEGKPQVDTASDFSPYCGNFTTPIYEFSVGLAGKEFSMRAGVLPRLMGAAVELLADGVFGMDFLKHFKVAVVNGGVWIANACTEIGE